MTKVEKANKPVTKSKPLGLEVLAAALSKGTAAIELKNIWFDNSVAFVANGRIGIEIPYKSGLQLGTPGSILIDVVKTASEDYKLTEEHNKLIVSFGRSRVQLAMTGLEGDIWKFPTKPPNKALAIPLTGELLKAFSVLEPVRPKGEARSVFDLGMVALPEKKMTTLYAGTKRAIGVVQVANFGVGQPLIIPYEFIDSLAHCEPEDELFILDNCLAVFGKRICVFAGKIDPSGLPDLRKVLETFNAAVSGRVRVPDELAAVLKRAVILDNNELKRDKLYVTMKGIGKDLQIKGSYKSGTLDETLACDAVMNGMVVMNVSRLNSTLAFVEEFAIVPKLGMVLNGKNVTFVLAQHGE